MHSHAPPVDSVAYCARVGLIAAAIVSAIRTFLIIPRVNSDQPGAQPRPRSPWSMFSRSRSIWLNRTIGPATSCENSDT